MKNSRRRFLQTVSSAALGILPISFSSPANDSFFFEKERVKEMDDFLFMSFKTPPNQARPFVRWWWNGNLIEKGEIVRQLDILKDAGIGGVEINTIQFPGKDKLGIDALQWLSPEWSKMVKFTLNEAQKRGMVCDIIGGTGWPFGANFLDEEDQCQTLDLNVDGYKLVGPATVRLSEQELLNKAGGSGQGYKKELFMVRLMPYYMRDFDQGIDITNRFEDGFLDVEIPSGVDQLLYVLVKTTGRQQINRSAPGGEGPVINYFNRSSVLKYLNTISTALNLRRDGLEPTIRSVFSDSLELSGNSWCDDLLIEFERRRGYSLDPYLPFIVSYSGNDGNPQGSRLEGEALEEIKRVRYDYVITKQELFEERFLETFVEWCDSVGVKSRVQGYGGVGYHPLESSMKVDIPENESWLGDHIGLRDHPGYTSINKFVSSGARLAGKKIVSCEEITNVSLVFFSTLEMIKICGDQSNISGVNHSILHGFNYSPLKAKFPGWVQFGTYFNERNTWWPFFKHWTDYKSRISSLFQIADAYADIAILHPLADKWSKFGQQFQPAFGWGVRYPWYEYELWCAVHQNGNTCDYVSEKIITQSKMENGRMQFNSCEYHTLIVMEVDSIHPDTAKAILEFARHGGKIFFLKDIPTKSTGFFNYRKNDEIVQRIMTDLIDGFPETCKVIPAPEGDLINWYETLQSNYNIKPKIKIDSPHVDILQSHYTYRDSDIYFIVNSSRSEAHQFSALFDVGEEKIPWIWDPETGERYRCPYGKERNRLQIELPPAQSMIIVYDENIEGQSFSIKKKDSSSGKDLAGKWEMRLEHIDGTITTRSIDALQDLKEDPEMKSFAGTIIYTKKFNSPMGYSLIDLGQVYDISEVEINGKELGVRWYGNHLYDLNGSLKNGTNVLEVKITTVVGNYCKSLKENETCQEWTGGQAYTSMGLIGPVKLYKEKV